MSVNWRGDVLEALDDEEADAIDDDVAGELYEIAYRLDDALIVVAYVLLGVLATVAGFAVYGLVRAMGGGW